MYRFTIRANKYYSNIIIYSIYMSLKIKILPVFEGDSISMIYGDEMLTNILIDTGPRRSYSKGPLKEEFKSLNKVEALILTHIDEDHIGGIIKYFEDINKKNDVFNKIIFNSGVNVAELLSLGTESNLAIPLIDSHNLDMSYKQGATLENALLLTKVWDKAVFVAGMSIIINGGTFHFLSPELTDLSAFCEQWEVENRTSFTDMSYSCDYNLSIDELIKKGFRDIGSLANKTSLAFMFEYERKRILFMGDAFPSIIEKNLRLLGYSENNKIFFDFIKVSHHGSKYAISPSLLSIINCENYIISTNGKHGNPTKECLARIIVSRPKVNLFYNYKNDITANIFSEEEIKLHEFSNIYIQDLPNPYTITISE